MYLPRANECEGPQRILRSGKSNFSSASAAAVPVLLTPALFVSLGLAGSSLRLGGPVTPSIRLDAEVCSLAALGTRRRVSGCAWLETEAEISS